MITRLAPSAATSTSICLAISSMVWPTPGSPALYQLLCGSRTSSLLISGTGSSMRKKWKCPWPPPLPLKETIAVSDSAGIRWKIRVSGQVDRRGPLAGRASGPVAEPFPCRAV